MDADSTWTGTGASRIRNDTNALLPIAINSKTLTSRVVFSNGTFNDSPGFGYRLTGHGNGTLYLKNPIGTNTADNIRLETGVLRVDNMAALGSGTITFAGERQSAQNVETYARFFYSGPTAVSDKPIVLDAGGGGIRILSINTTLTLSDVISETGGTGRGLSVHGNFGGGQLELTADNTYTGPTQINLGGTLSIPTIANGGVASPLGASSSAAANLRLGGGIYGDPGTLRYTGPTASTDRGVTLGSAADKSTIDVSTAGSTLTMSGQFVGPGGLTNAGPGMLSLTGTGNYAGTTTVAGGTLQAINSVYNAAVFNGGGLDLKAGKFVFNYGTTSDPVATVKAILTNGYNQTTKFSSGQIRATGLPANRTLGYGDNGSAVTVMLTIPGDANLDGTVNFNDVLVLQNNFSGTNTRFDQGNFNYDGVTDFNDFLVLQNNFGQGITGITVPATSSEIAALTAFANAAVPEPTSLALIGVGVGVLGRRHRQIKCSPQ